MRLLLKEYIKEKGNYEVIYRFDKIIATTSKGVKTSTLKVFLDKTGNVLNSYPIANYYSH